MKIIKFKPNIKFNYKRKVIIKNLILNIFIGIHNFEKKKKQRVKFNLVININQNLVPNDKDLKSIVNYEQVIKVINKIIARKHYLLLETLAEKIFFKLFENPRIKKILLRIEKLDVIKNTTSVGIELEKTRSNEY